LPIARGRVRPLLNPPVELMLLGEATDHAVLERALS
jgi:hypothetical protein